MVRKFLIIFILLIGNFSNSQNNQLNDTDSLEYYIQKTQNNKLSYIERLSNAKRAKRLAIKLKNDSLTNESLRQIALNHYRLKNNFQFKKSSREFLNFSRKIKDSSGIARANWYLGEFFYNQAESDSAYYYFYNAEKIYKSLNDNSNNLVYVLDRIAIIQRNEKDFIGSEVTTIEAIEFANLSPGHDRLSSLYNNLGIVYNELGQFEESINYHEDALELRKRMIDSTQPLVEHSYNNIAVAYKNNNQYEKALDNFNLILQNNEVVNKFPSFHALVLDNYAHTNFLLNQTTELPELYHEALKICDIAKREYEKIAINIHLSEYYKSLNQLDSAKHYAYQAKNIAIDYHNDDYLKSLLNLSEIEDDSLSVKYYQEYIKLNDSLVKNEREVRNKFARIRYETKEIELRNERITKERLYLLILSIGLLLTIFLTYSTISQRAKNKELKLKQLQQEANEEIYNLMLSQQDKIEEGRTKEKNRISEELHDGILGRLFGTRLSLDSLNLSNKEEAAENRSVYIDELKSIEQEIRKISHDLSSDFVEGSSYFDIIKTLVENQTQAYQLNYDLKKNGEIDWETVSNKTKINLYRIVQESLQNIYKHANAKHVDIKFDSKDDFIILDITDDGSGFDTNKARKGIGLKNIKSRAEEIKGELIINSKKEHGTSLKVKVPK